MILLRIMGLLPVTLTPDDNQRWWIAGDPLLDNSQHSAMSEDSRTIQRQSANQSGAGWPFQKKTDTGNEALTLSFSTSRTFDTLEEAWDWRNSFSSLDDTLWPHPIEGDCVMRCVRDDDTFSEARLYDCLLAKPTMKSNGVSIELSYTLTGGRIETYATGVDALPMEDAYAHDAPTAGLFLTSTGGDPVLDDVQTWSDTTESLNGWRLYIQATDGTASPSTIYYNFYFGVAGASSLGGSIDLAPPMKDRLAAIAAALDPTWFDAEIVSEGGRDMLRLRNIRGPEHLGTLYPPQLSIEIWQWTPRSPNTQLLGNVSTGTTTLFEDVIPFDDALETPVADDAA